MTVNSIHIRAKISNEVQPFFGMIRIKQKKWTFTNNEWLKDGCCSSLSVLNRTMIFLRLCRVLVVIVPSHLQFVWFYCSSKYVNAYYLISPKNLNILFYRVKLLLISFGRIGEPVRICMNVFGVYFFPPIILSSYSTDICSVTLYHSVFSTRIHIYSVLVGQKFESANYFTKFIFLLWNIYVKSTRLCRYRRYVPMRQCRDKTHSRS